MTKQIRLIVIMLLVSIVLAMGIVLLDSTEKIKESDGTILKNLTPDAIQDIEIDNEFGSIHIEYLESGYLVGEVPAELVDYNKFITMMTNSAAVYAAQTIIDNGELAAYGLDEPQASVHVTYFKDKPLVLYIGEKERVSNGYYCKVDGDNHIYLFEADRVQAYLQPEKYYINSYVTPAKPEQSISASGHVLGMTMTGGNLDEPVVLTPVSKDDPQSLLDVMSFGSATHLIAINDRRQRVDQKYG